MILIPQDPATMIEKEIASFSGISGSLSERQQMLINPFVYSKWDMFSKSIQGYRDLLKHPDMDAEEIISFIKSEYNKMEFPDTPGSFQKYLKWYHIE